MNHTSKKTNDPSTISAQEACFDFARMIFIFATRPKSEARNRIRTRISLNTSLSRPFSVQFKPLQQQYRLYTVRSSGQTVSKPTCLVLCRMLRFSHTRRALVSLLPVSNPNPARSIERKYVRVHTEFIPYIRSGLQTIRGSKSIHKLKSPSFNLAAAYKQRQGWPSLGFFLKKRHLLH